MNERGGLSDRIKTGLGIGLLVAVTGCVGYVGPDGGGVVVAEPDVYVGGVWEGGYVGHDRAHDWGHRGAVSRGFAHAGGHGGGWGGRR